MNQYKYCPNCKSDLDRAKEKAICKNCGYEIYFDPSPTAAGIPIKDGKILMAIRAVEPYKGGLDLIGGFIKQGESAEEAIIREVKEETGLDVKIVKFFKSYPDIYGSSDKPVLGIDFILEITGGVEKANDDVSELKWIYIKDIPTLEINSFENVKVALKDLYDQYGRGAEN